MSSSANPSLSIIIPAYNEKDRLGSTLHEVDKYIRNNNFKAEIIVVNDGSTDETEAVIEKAETQISSLRHIVAATNQGKGEAVRAGMLAAQGDIKLYMDADNSTPIQEWERLKPHFINGADIVIGSRRITGAKILVRQSGIRELLGWLFRKVAHAIVPMEFEDTQNGFKAFTSKAADILFLNLKVAGWAFDVELLHKAKQLDLTVVEVPIEWANDPRSHMTFLAMFRMLADLVRIRLQSFSPKADF